MWTIIFGLGGFIAVLYFGLRILGKRRARLGPGKALVRELAALEADLPHDFLKLARAEATKKLEDKKRKRVEQIYLENPDLLK